MFEVKNLTAGYGKTQIIKNIGFSMGAGEKVAVLGRNGVGKTTLLATLMGITDMAGGVISLNGVDMGAWPISARARAGLGYVPQTRDVFPSLTVRDNLRIGLKPGSEMTLDDAYALFPRLVERKRNYAGKLSGGEQQMLSIARSILGSPTVLLLDEPLEGLAPVICDELMAALLKMTTDRSLSVVLVEQNIDRAMDFAERIIILERGMVAWSGASKQLREDPEIVERYMGVSAFH